MQRQRGKMVLMPESFEIDRASSSSGAALDQQHCWDNVRGPPESHFPGFVHPINNSGIPFTSSVNHEQGSVSAWSMGEASSSTCPYRSSNSDYKVENEWPSTVGRHGIRIEDSFGMSSGGVLPLDDSIINPIFIQGSGSSSTSSIVNSNGIYVDPSEENPSLMECYGSYKSSGAIDNQRPVQPTNLAHQFIPSGSNGFSLEESEVRLRGSLDNRRVPCKRKSFEGHAGQSFTGNPNCPRPMESNPWQGTPQCLSMTSGHANMEQSCPGLCLDLVGGAIPQSFPNMESSGVPRRNFRLRVNSFVQNDSRPTSLSTALVAAAGNPAVTSAPQASSRAIGSNRTLELPPPTTLSGPAPDGQHPLLQVPIPAPGGHFVRWNRGLIIRNNTSTSGPIVADGASLNSHSRNILHQQPMLVPNLSSSSMRGLMNANNNCFPTNAPAAPPGSSISAAPPGSSSSAAQLSHRSSLQQANHHHPRYPRRLSEYVRRQLLSSIGPDLMGSQDNHNSYSSGRPLLPRDVLHSSSPGSARHGQSLSRSALWMERQGDNVIGSPYPVRTLAASSERQRRFATELRNVLELVRRGGFRVEDVMILDPSMFFGVANMHDRHRDMRLDVDNMSYEELLALEERIGNVCTGLNEETILSRMKQRKHSNIPKTQMEAEPCCICQEEYNEGEEIGTLECGHDFHRDCIKQWLMHKNLCPICKMAGLTI
ncbi:hypothetical protein SAY86_004019 [Trapa natans]|uniref:RING-type E3 ubiquitin transferase n=1 Tax=Trapa natans TaxID=22666 RepID=A0AAN7MUI8_TRANT|nr:hypothetical protein SAY86_004019 [Trapa natans]